MGEEERVKGQNAGERFERKINAGFVFSVPELVEKHSFPNILTHFQQHLWKNCNFVQKSQFLAGRQLPYWYQTTIYDERVSKFYGIYYIRRYEIVEKSRRTFANPF